MKLWSISISFEKSTFHGGNPPTAKLDQPFPKVGWSKMPVEVAQPFGVDLPQCLNYFSQNMKRTHNSITYLSYYSKI